jgi:hypothetical protein
MPTNSRVGTQPLPRLRDPGAVALPAMPRNPRTLASMLLSSSRSVPLPILEDGAAEDAARAEAAQSPATATASVDLAAQSPPAAASWERDAAPCVAPGPGAEGVDSNAAGAPAAAATASNGLAAIGRRAKDGLCDE